MQTTVEISLYPLKDTYVQVVLDFLAILNLDPELTVETNGLSTQIFGEYKHVMSVLSTEMMHILEKHSAVFILKIAKGELRYNK